MTDLDYKIKDIFPEEAKNINLILMACTKLRIVIASFQALMSLHL